AAGLTQIRPQLENFGILMTRASRHRATQRVKDLMPVPARPAVYVYELARKVKHDGPVDARTDTFVRERVALARVYGTVVLDPARELLAAVRDSRLVLGNAWTCRHLRQWRERTGYSATRP